MVESTLSAAQQAILASNVNDFPTGGVTIGGQQFYNANQLEATKNNLRDIDQRNQIRASGQDQNGIDSRTPSNPSGQSFSSTQDRLTYGSGNAPTASIHYSQPNSLTGGGIVTDTGKSPFVPLSAKDSNLPGVYQTLQGQFPAGTQVTITEGPKGNTAGEYIKQLSGNGRFNPGRLIDESQYGVNNINYITNSKDNVQSSNAGRSGTTSGSDALSRIYHYVDIPGSTQNPGEKIIRNAFERQQKGQEQINDILGINEPYTGSIFPYYTLSDIGRFGKGVISFVPSTVNQLLGTGQTIFGQGVSEGYNVLTGRPEKNFEKTRALVSAVPEAIGTIGSGFGKQIGTPEGQGQIIAGVGLSQLGDVNINSENPVVVSPRSGGAAITRATENTLTSTQNLLGVAKVEGERVPVQTKVLLTGERVPNTDFFTTRVETVSAIPTSKGTQFVTQDFVGPLNTRNSLLSLTNREGTKFFFTQTGRGEPAMFDTVSSIEKNPSRFINLGTEPGSVIPLVRNTGEANILSETNPVTKVPYAGRGGVNVFGAPKTETFIESNTGFLNKGGGGANPDLFSGGFQNLERAGLYKDAYIVQGKGLSILASRRGAIGETISSGAYRPLTEGEPVTSFPKGTSVSKAPSPLDLSGLEITGRITTTKTASAPIIPLLETPVDNSTVLNPTVVQDTTLSPTTQNSDTTIISGPDTIFVPTTDTTTKTLLDTSTTQLSGTTQGTIPATKQNVSPATSQSSAQDISQSQSFRQSISQEQQYLTKSQTGQDTIFKSNAGFFNEPTGKGKEEQPLDIGNRLVKKNAYPGKRGKSVQAYNVFLKRKGNFELLGQGLTRNEALLKGERAALGDLAATFKLVKDGTTTERNAPRPGDLDKYFRNYAIRKGRPVPLVDTYIQKRGLRLVSQQERGQLQAARQRSSKRGGYAWI